MSSPKIIILIGLLTSILFGSIEPFFGIFISKTFFALNQPVHKVRNDTDNYCMWIIIISGATFFLCFVQKFSFGIIGENVSFRIRKSLYSSILTKHIGFFDEKKNAPGVL